MPLEGEDSGGLLGRAVRRVVGEGKEAGYAEVARAVQEVHEEEMLVEWEKRDKMAKRILELESELQKLQ